MAQKLASMVADNGKVVIGCPVGPMLKPLLHSQMQVTQSSLVDQDEYHLIMEYAKGEKLVALFKCILFCSRSMTVSKVQLAMCFHIAIVCCHTICYFWPVDTH